MFYDSLRVQLGIGAQADGLENPGNRRDTGHPPLEPFRMLIEVHLPEVITNLRVKGRFLRFLRFAIVLQQFKQRVDVGVQLVLFLLEFWVGICV